MEIEICDQHIGLGMLIVNDHKSIGVLIIIYRRPYIEASLYTGVLIYRRPYIEASLYTGVPI